METFEKIKEIIHELAGIPEDRINLNSTAEQLELDSLDLTEVILAVEEEFDVVVYNEDTIKELRDLVDCVCGQIEAA